MPSNGHPATPPSKPRPAPSTPPPKPNRPFPDKRLEFQWQEEHRERERQTRELALFQRPPSLGPQGMESSTPTGSSNPPLAEQPGRLLKSHPPPVTAKHPGTILEPLTLTEAAEQPSVTLEPLPPELEQPKIPPKPPAVDELVEPLPPAVDDCEALLEPLPLPVTEAMNSMPHSAEDLFPPVIAFEHPRQAAEGSYSSQSSRSASPSDSSCSEYDPQPYAPTSETAVLMETTRESLNIPMVLPEEPTAAEVMLKPINEEHFSEEMASTSTESSSDEFQPSEEGSSRQHTVDTQAFKEEPVHTYTTEQPLPERYSEPTQEQPPAVRKVHLEKTTEESTFEESSIASMTQPIVMQMAGPVEVHGELKIRKVDQTHWTPQGKHWTQSQWETPEPRSPTHSPYRSLESPQVLPGPQPQQQATRHHASPPTLQNGQAQLQQAPPPTRKRSEPHPPSMSLYPPPIRSYTWSSKDRPKDGPQQAYAIRASNSYEPCSRCRKPLGRGQVMSLPLACLQFHLHCFTCHVCHSALSRDAQNTSVLIHGSLPHCHYCFSNEKGQHLSQARSFVRIFTLLLSLPPPGVMTTEC